MIGVSEDILGQTRYLLDILVTYLIRFGIGWMR